MTSSGKPAPDMSSDAEFDPFAGPALALTAPSTEPQRELWTAVQMGADASCAFNESISLELEGALDEGALRAALQDLVQRHEALRTTFTPDGTTLLVAEVAALELPVVDLSGLAPEAQRAEVSRALAHEVETAFDLAQGPLARARLLKLGAQAHRLTFTAHHIVCDGWSMAVLLKDLAAFYSAHCTGIPAYLPPAPAFSAYARAQREAERSPEMAAAQRYWLGQFAGEPPAPLELPADRARPAAKTYASEREDVVLEPALVEAVKGLGRKAGCSFFSTLLAGFDVLLSRLTHQEDVVVGIPSAGQSASGQAQLVGHCVNTLALRSRVAPERSFLDVARAVRTTMLDGAEHQQLTYGALLKQLPLPRDPSRLPLASVLFNVDQALSGAQLPFEGLAVRYSSNPRHFENFDLFVNAAEADGRLVLECQYNRDLYERATVRGWMDAYAALLAAAVAQPQAPVSVLNVVPAQQAARMQAWNAATARELPRGACVHTLVAEAARSHGGAVAVQLGTQSLTYAELDARANQLAHHLRAQGVQRGTLVGLCLERSLDMVVALHAVLRAGGAYVPLDPAFPADRLAFMVEDSRMAVLVTQRSLRAEAPKGAATVVELDAAREALAQESTGPLPQDARSATPDDVAYVIYTSGSTGKPKGVQVHHRAVVNFLLSMREEPGLSSKDTLLAVTTLSFDIAVLELYLPLLVGARVLLASRDMAVDGARLRAAVEAEGVTVMQATPSTWRLMLGAGWQGGAGFKALVGGEALPRDLAGTLARAAGAGLFNMYGPTETTVWSTLFRIPASGEPVRIGRPIANTQVHVLDARLQPVPLGVAGELHIGGEGVTLGYLHRPELTAERFIADPARPGARLYKTGDVARLLADGTLEYLGRNDGQVKVRGYRIELGEIEAVLAKHPSVKEAVVLVREDCPGDVRLVAYAVPRAQLADDAALRAHLRQSLPEYMVPQHFVSLPAFPLTPNGKVHRKALPAPQGPSAQAASSEYVAPRTEQEQLLASLWQQVLGVPRLSVHDNFFELGGHSLLAAQAMSRLQKEHGLALGMRKLFEAPTVAQLAQLLPQPGAAAVAPAAGIPRYGGEGPAPVSLMQQRLWFAEQMDPGNTVYNLPSAFRLKGRLDVAALERALNALVARHESLRTTLRWEGDRAVQVVAPALTISLPPVDLRGVPEAEREAECLRQLHDAANQPFRLSEGPLFSAKLLVLRDEENVLFWMPHHAIWDGWSFDVFLKELSALYDAFRQGLPSPLAPLPIRYADFAAWHRDWLDGAELARQSAYWKQQLAGELPVLELPTDKPRPATLSYRGATVPFSLTKAEIAALTGVGRQSGATLYMVLLAAFKALLHRHTGQEDIIVGTPIRGRSQPETEELLGFFVNTLVLRTGVSPGASFASLLEQVRTTTLDAFSHQDMPFEQLLKELNVARDLSRTPVFQAFFTFQDVSNRNTSIGPLPYSQINVHCEAAPTDLSLWVKETGEGLVGGLDFATDLFERATGERFLAQYKQLLASVVQDPRAQVGALEVLPPAQRAQLSAWNAASARAFPPGGTAVALLAGAASRFPDAVALDFEGQQLTYAQLHSRAHQLAHHLRGLGVKRGTLVGLCVERGPEMLVGLLGILHAGGAYVPLDPAFPQDRLAFMVEDSRLRVLVTQERLRALLPAVEGGQVVRLDADAAALALQPSQPLPQDAAGAQPEDPAYVIYTSGSTGKPKGVLVPHRAVVNFLRGVAEEPGLTAKDALLAVTTLSFDIAVLELYLPLSVGGRVVLASRQAAQDGARLRALLEEGGVTTMQATPSTWRLLLATGWQPREGFKALVGGEALPPDLAATLASRCASAFNMYGPTETTVWSTVYRLPASGSPVLIGHPLANQQVHVLDARLQPVPVGVPGELFIGGEGVTLGYLHRPELTAERFVADPVRPGARMYRTGDVVRRLADGQLEYLRRNDFQVKVRGYRIELGEIEAALATHPAVRETVVLVREDRPGDQRLVAYLVPAPGADYTDSELRKHLRAVLPDYMVPQHFLALEAFPLTPNNKLDRRALPAPQGLRAPAAAQAVPPRTAQEKLLAALWQEALGAPCASVHDNFFNLGGHSLLCLQVISQVERRTGVRLNPRVMLLNSLQQVAAMLPEPAAPAASTAAQAPAPAVAPPAPGSFAQRMLEKLKRGKNG